VEQDEALTSTLLPGISLIAQASFSACIMQGRQGRLGKMEKQGEMIVLPLLSLLPLPLIGF
jgi:hypothetical protein